ncbi:hypothetical protein RM550_05125 [Streptomyces sp. DSM 41527]|uniref:MFS transporter n=1 Tax=Streptomyces mooreae TaxID=3075523 RepID=A0ABU2T1L7_9ACTN|nr:hypothetical protein [Streptomyces sp. DSM 41527]MDT0455123.1 hypothetical protein [Streptomyces sp. DSM 41527]
MSVTIAVFALPAARPADRWGRVRTIAAMGSAWSLAALACAVSGNYAQLALAFLKVRDYRAPAVSRAGGAGGAGGRDGAGTAGFDADSDAAAHTDSDAVSDAASDADETLDHLGLPPNRRPGRRGVPLRHPAPSSADALI